MNNQLKAEQDWLFFISTCDSEMTKTIDVALEPPSIISKLYIPTKRGFNVQFCCGDLYFDLLSTRRQQLIASREISSKCLKEQLKLATHNINPKKVFAKEALGTALSKWNDKHIIIRHKRFLQKNNIDNLSIGSILMFFDELIRVY
jgi:hypothetical protein